MVSRFDRRTFSIGTLAASLGLGLAGRPAARAAQSEGVINRVDPDQAAVDQSRLEVKGRIPELYLRMHPDAQAEVPLYAVAYWYETTFLPSGPNVIEVTDWFITEWTWPVTGETYAAYQTEGGAPVTAEVAYHQTFADGSTRDDTLHLVQQPTNEWRWFFGQSREFIDEQVALAEENGVTSISPVPEWAAAATANNLDGYANVPEAYPGAEDATLERLGSTGLGGHESCRYVTADGTIIARVEVSGVATDVTTAIGAIQTMVTANSGQYETEVLGWSLTPATDAVFMSVRFSAEGEPDTVATYVGDTVTPFIVKISAPDEDVVTALGEAMAG